MPLQVIYYYYIFLIDSTDGMLTVDY